jgi:hypothetical protein
MRRLGTDPALRAKLGAAARTRWRQNHSIAVMVADYRTLIVEAMRRPVPSIPLPAHLLDEGRGTLERLIEPFGLPSPLGNGAPLQSAQ